MTSDEDLRAALKDLDRCSEALQRANAEFAESEAVVWKILDELEWPKERELDGMIYSLCFNSRSIYERPTVRMIDHE